MVKPALGRWAVSGFRRASTFVGGASQRVLDKWWGDLPDPNTAMLEYLNRQGRDGTAIFHKARGLDYQKEEVWQLPRLSEEPDPFVFKSDGRDVRFVVCKLESKTS